MLLGLILKSKFALLSPRLGQLPPLIRIPGLLLAAASLWRGLAGSE